MKDKQSFQTDSNSASPKKHIAAISICHDRLVWVMIAFVLVFSVLSIRVLSLGIVGGKANEVTLDFAEKSNEPELFYSRAPIEDRNGVLLAVNLQTASLYANPLKMIDVEDAINKLKTVFPDIDEKTLRSRFESKRHFVWVKRNLTPLEHSQANALGIPGLYFTEEEKRVYPHGNALAHALGYTDIDGKGLAGIENNFDGYLRNIDDANPSMEPLRLSIDIRVQSTLRQELMDGLEAYKAKAAVGVMMDVNTGEVVAISSLPDFDPHHPSRISKDQRFNRATLGVYEMGSTFKTFTMAMGLESGKIGMDTSYDVSKPLQVSRFTVKDYHPHDGMMSFPEIFVQSSNIGTAQVALEVGESRQRAFLSSLGLLDRIDIEVPEKGVPLYPDRWGKTAAVTISYGHGIAVTPVHLVRSIASMVNGGVLYPSTFLKHETGNMVEGIRVISQKTSKQMRQLMRFAVKYGTGGRAENVGYMVGGKTGTADKATVGGYQDGGVVSSFVSVFPMHQPRYVLYVMYDEPKSDRRYVRMTGGVTAAVTAGRVIRKVAPVLEVQPVDENRAELARQFTLKSREEEIDTSESF